MIWVGGEGECFCGKGWSGSIALNEIGQVRVRLAEPLPVDDYVVSRRTGSFVLIDPSDGNTLAAGLIGAPLPIFA